MKTRSIEKILGRYRSLVFIILLLVLANCDKENDTVPEEYYMTAEIDGELWEIHGFDNARFSAEYVPEKERFSINIHADDLYKNSPQDHGKAIFIDFDFTPTAGRYAFNNDGSTNLDSGIIAVHLSWDSVTNSHTPKWSTDGFVEITSISKDLISGTFSFSAVGGYYPVHVVIKNGKFSAFYGGGNLPWPGPE